MRNITNELIAYLQKSVSAFHAIKNACDALDAQGYVRLAECAPYAIVPGGKYYITRNRSSLIAFRIPQRGFAPMQIVASHSDSPVFRVKQHAEISVQGKYIMLNTERYGGMIMSTWLDRPLSVAGRVLVRDGSKIKSRLINIDRDLLLIPNLAIHMNRDMNDGVKLNAQVDMLPVFGDGAAKDTFDDLIAEAAGTDKAHVAGSDLFLYSRMQPTLWGDGKYISAPRLDDLECAYTSLAAFLNAKDADHINMLCIFDNEEVGSGTRQGADSTFLTDAVERIADALGADSQKKHACIAASFLVSADNAHAMHPNHPEKADPVNRPFMNEGVVIKFSANQKYCTDGISNAIFAGILKDADVPVQYFLNRSDSLGGSTLGNISIAHISIPSVDIGLAQLAMHSSYETAGAQDIDHMVNGLTAFYNAEIRAHDDGEYTIE